MRLLASIFLIFLSSTLFGQGNATTRSLQKQFEQAIHASDAGNAIRIFHELFALDSNQSWPLAGGIAKLLNAEDPRPGLLDTLARTYQIGARQNPEASAEFAQKKAFLAFRFPDHFKKVKSIWLREAIDRNPFQCALQLYRFWGDELEAKMMRNRITLGRVAEEWASFDRFLFARELLYPLEAKSTHQTRVRIHRQLAALVPDCDGIRKTLKVTSEDSQLYQGLVLSSLQRCRDETAWLRYEQALPDHAPAWAQRLLAYHYLNTGETDKCLTALKLAIGKEKLPILKADLHSQSARIFLEKGNYREARAQILAAIRMAPTWGDLYLTLADIYLVGAESCGFNEFDSKAVYWLAIDLTQRAINSSPHLQQEANQRIYEYKLQMPKPQEVEFRGLSAGDTWPLKCWMSTVTTVKVE